MELKWVESDALAPGGGHGVDFFAGDPWADGSLLVAVVRGFEWLHGNPETVEVEILRPGGDFDSAFQAETRASIQGYFGNPSVGGLDRRVSETIWAHING